MAHPEKPALLPHIVVKGAAEAIDFYKKAFGAEEYLRFPMPDGKTLMHAEIGIGGARIMMVDEMPNMDSKAPTTLGGTPVTMHINVPDVDAVFAQAVEAGCTAVMAPEDMFWGDRYARVADPYGHSWAFATHVRDVSPEEMAEAAAKMFG